MPIKIISLNVRGLNSPQKRTTLQKDNYNCKTTKQQADIVFLQEMHFASTKTTTIKMKGYNQLFLASGPKKKNGVLTVIKDSLQFQLHQSYVDPQGRCLILICDIGQSTYTLVNIYGPNTKQISFHKRLCQKLTKKLQRGSLILEGDFNILHGHRYTQTIAAKCIKPLSLNNRPFGCMEMPAWV